MIKLDDWGGWRAVITVFVEVKARCEGLDPNYVEGRRVCCSQGSVQVKTF